MDGTDIRAWDKTEPNLMDSGMHLYGIFLKKIILYLELYKVYLEKSSLLCLTANEGLEYHTFNSISTVSDPTRDELLV